MTDTSELAGTSALTGRSAAAGASSPVGRAATVAKAYFLLTKPRVIELLLVTTVPAMILAAGEIPRWSLIVEVLLGGALAAGGANTINCWIERDRDQVMGRTRNRPLPTGAVTPEGALVFGLVLELAAFALLATRVNVLSACLAVGATLFYVFVYTIWLKPRSPQNIVIGGAAGAVPVLVGWASVTNGLAAAAWVMFAIVFFWTPPHFWALSLRYYDDYKRAGIPMLPVAKGIPRTLAEMVAYSFVVVAATLLLPVVSDLGAVYVIAASALGVVFVVQAVRLARAYSPERAITFFTLSNTYLALLFAAVAVDTLLRSV